MDRLTPERRSRLMSRIGSANTKPELGVRSILHRMGYRFRIHGKGLPGTPDVVLPRWRAVVLVHGCFWHGHACKRRGMPKSRVDYWAQKIHSNRLRDRRTRRQLQRLGWTVIVVWECELKQPERLILKLKQALTGDQNESRESI